MPWPLLNRHFTLLLLGISAAALARPPEVTLRLCQRDGKNLVGRAQRNPEAERTALAQYAKRCIEGPDAEAIRALPGYEDVQAVYEQARGLIEGAVAREQQAAQDATDAAQGSPAGGTPREVAERWKARPRHCIDPEAWAVKEGLAPKVEARAARVSTGQSNPGARPNLFSLNSNFLRFERLSPREHLARIACGVRIEGLDPSFRQLEDGLSGPMYDGLDRRAALAEALSEDAEGPARRVVYQAALAYHCYAVTSWKVPEDAAPYLFCADAVEPLPTAQAVAAAVEEVFPERRFEQQNLLYLHRRALEAKPEVDQAFAAIAASSAKLKSVLGQAAERARKEHAEARRPFAEMIRELDPLTEQLLRDPTSAPPAGCEERLLQLRETLASQLKPRDQAGVDAVQALHPVGYQISEALAFCYKANGKRARARLEADALYRFQRRVTFAEAIYFARQRAIDEQVRGGAKVKLTLPVPSTVVAAGKFFEALEDTDFSLRGDTPGQPAIVAAKTPRPEGVELTFRTVSRSYPYRDVSCRNTNRVLRYDFRGKSVHPVYEQECQHVGPVMQRTVTTQEAPVILPPEEARRVAVGMRVKFLAEREGKEATLAWLGYPDEAKKPPVVINGITVR